MEVRGWRRAHGGERESRTAPINQSSKQARKLLTDFVSSGGGLKDNQGVTDKPPPASETRLRREIKTVFQTINKRNMGPVEKNTYSQ